MHARGIQNNYENPALSFQPAAHSKALEAPAMLTERKTMFDLPLFVASQTDLPADYRKLLVDNYWELLDNGTSKPEPAPFDLAASG